MKVGRWTVAGALIVIGVTLLLNQWAETNLFLQMIPWWPVLLIALGIEVMVSYSRGKEDGRRRKFDVAGLIVLSLIVVVGAGTALAQDLGFNISFRDGFNVAIGENGEPHELERLVIPVKEQQLLKLENDNGSIDIAAYDGNDVVVEPTLLLSAKREGKLEKIKKEVRFDVNEKGHVMSVEVKRSKSQFSLFNLFRGDDFYAVRLQVKVPRALAVDAKTLNGKVVAQDVRGDVTLESLNGDIQIAKIEGNAVLETANGSIRGTDVSGSVHAETSNGSIHLQNVSEAVEVETTLGSIDLTDVAAAVRAETSAGSIVINSRKIGGNWRVFTSAGKIDVTLPETADARIRAETTLGKVTSDFPLDGGKGHRGSVGNGTYDIDLETSAGSIAIKKTE